MTTRRDLLKLASALGLAGTIPTTAERIAAAQILDASGTERTMLNPGAFAKELHLSVGGWNEQFESDWYGSICPEEEAEVSRLNRKLDQVSRESGIDLYQVVGDYQAASVAMFLAMYRVGLRHGAAYENLRRSIVGDVVQCTTWWGTGIAYDREHKKDIEDRPCYGCGGTGTVAMKDGAR